MDEKELAVLNQFGYSLNEIGAIIDGEGNYVSDAEYLGTRVESPVSEKQFTDYTDKQATLKDAGFVYNPEDTTEKYIQEDIFLAKEHLREFEASPETTPIPDANTDPAYKAGFDALQKEKAETSEDGMHYTDPDSMMDGLEEGTIYQDLAPEQANELRAVRREKQKIQAIDPDYKTVLRAEKGVAVTPMGILPKPSEDDDMMTKGTYTAYKAMNDFMSNTIASITPSGKGMEDKEKKAEYLDLIKKERELIVPVAMKQLEEVNQQIAAIEEAQKGLSSWSAEWNKYGWAQQVLEKQKGNLNDYIDDSLIDTNVFSTGNALDWASSGLNQIVGFAGVADLRNKNDNGEELTAGEMAIIEAMDLEGRVGGKGYEYNFARELTGGVNNSLQLLGFGAYGRAAGKTSMAIIGNNVTGKAASFVSQVGNLATQTAMHPFTHSYAFKKYAGEAQTYDNDNGERQVIMGQRGYETLKLENEHNINEITDALARARAADDVEKIKEYDAHLKQLNNFDKYVKEPSGMGNAYAYGATEMAKEIAAEMYVGAALKGVGKFTGTSASRFFARNPRLSKLNTKLNTMASTAKSNFNRKYGTVPGHKLIGSNTEEILEEVAVQITPTYGEGDKYGEQLGELATLDFYKLVVGQTLAMQKGFAMYGAASKQLAIYRMDASQREKRKETIKLYKEMGKKSIDQNKFNAIFMMAGEGNFSMQEYNNTINGLKERGLIEEASEVERTKLYKQAQAAQQAGLLNEFNKSLKSAKYNKNLDAGTIANIAMVQGDVNEMMDDDNNYINNTEVIQAKSKLKYAERTMEKLHADTDVEINESNKELSNIVGFETTVGAYAENMWDASDTRKENDDLYKNVSGNMDNLSENLQASLTREMASWNLSKSIYDLEKQVKQLTSFKHQTALRHNAEYTEYLNELNKKLYNGNVSSAQFMDMIEKIPAKKQKFVKDRVDKLHLEVAAQLLMKEAQSSNKASAQNINTTEVTPSETGTVTEVQGGNNTVPNTDTAGVTGSTNNVIQTYEDNSAPPDLTEEDDSIVFTPRTDFVDSFKQWRTAFVEENNTEPVFEDFLKVAMEMHGKDTFVKENIQDFGDTWEAAELGNSNWENLYKKYYEDVKTITGGIINGMLGKETSTNRQNPVVTNEVSEQTSATRTEPVGPVDPGTGETIKITSVQGKTAVITPKANFNALRYDGQFGEVKEVNGQKIVEYRKEDTETVPILNTVSPLAVKELLHPDNNNPGDVWNIHISNESDWNESTLVSVNANTGEPTSFIPFTKWIKNNQPADMSLADFKKTDEYIAKVPVYYVDKKGNRVAAVADVDWYNATNVRDTSKKIGDVVVLNSLTAEHQEKIDEGRENAMNMRRAIASGMVKQVTIESKDGSPWIKFPMKDANGNILPAPTLAQAAPDNKLVFFKGDHFVNFNKEDINKRFNDPEDDHDIEIEVVNLEKIKEGSKSKGDTTEEEIEKKKGKVYSTFYLSPINKVGNKHRYEAISVLRKNEDNQERAFSEDIQTVKYILAAQKALWFKEDKAGMSQADAAVIRQQVLDATNNQMDIMQLNDARELANSLIALEEKVPATTDAQGNIIKKAYTKKHTVESKNIAYKTKQDKVETGDFFKVLFASDFTPVQNTNIGRSYGINIKQEGGKFTTSLVAETYEKFLQQRLSTNIVSYNMGTAEKPAYTHSVQPIIKVEPIITEETEVKAEVITADTKAVIEQADDLFDELGIDDDILGDDVFTPPILTGVDNLKASLNVVPGLTINQQTETIDFILGKIARAYEARRKGTEAVAPALNYYKDLQKKVITVLGNVTKAHNTQANSNLATKINKLNATADKISTIIDNYGVFYQKARAIAEHNKFIPSNQSDIENEGKDHIDEETNEKNFYKSSSEDIHKEKIGGKLRRIFATVENNETKGFLGVPKHENYDVIYNTAITLIISPLPPNPTFASMIRRLESYKKTYPWMESLVKELNEADQDTKNSFVSNMYKYRAQAKFVIFSRNNKGMSPELWNSNANDIKRKIKENWNNEFKRSDITNDNTLNTEKLSALHKQWENWGAEKHKQTDKVLRKWLSDFGISLSDGTWKDLRAGRMVAGSGRTARALPFSDLFFEDQGGRLFSNLANFAKKYKDSEQGTLDFVTNPKAYHPHLDMSGILKSLTDIELRHNANITNVSRRDGGKNVSEVVYPDFFKHNVRKLILSAKSDEQSYLHDLAAIPFSSGSNTLELLLNDPDFASIFEYGEVGLEALQEMYKKSNPYANIDQLASIDYMFTQRAAFQFLKTESFKRSQDGFALRVGTISTPTNSDKGRMMLLKTAVYDLFKANNAFDSNEDGTFNFSDELKKMIYKRLITPELDRILTHKDKNIKGYNDGAKRFNLIPVLNTIQGTNGKTTLDFLSTNKNKDAFEKEFFSPIMSYIESSIKAEADANIKATQNTDEKVDSVNGAEYLSKRQGTPDQKKVIAEYDYIINSMIGNMNTMQLISGDPAIYYNEKNLKHDSLSPIEQAKISKDLGVNMGKRMALMIAPGNVQAQEANESYIQLFLEDHDQVAQNVEEIIAWHYGKNALTKEDKQTLADLRRNDVAEEALDLLKLKFSKVAAFLKIESTDAQEYTTLKEHLDVMVGFGTVTREKANSIMKKSDDGTLTREDPDVQIVLQPMKPVYTGDVMEDGVRRVVYIKSSSFPLIPALVNGTKLQPLMDKMNQIQKEQGLNVRASYQSANKVGALIGDSVINPLNNESLATLDAKTEQQERALPTHSLKLDRINFKIQQNVPFHSDEVRDDKVSMGTQIFKLLFGDGITELDGFMLDGVEMNGQQLKSAFFDSFSTMVNMQKDKLLAKLSLDNKYNAKNPLQSAQKLQELLMREAEERNFPVNDIKSLEIQSHKIGGKEVYHFKSPLWFSGNSNKFESMLNAIIGNKIFKQKLPGNSFVVGSENGLQIKESVIHAKGNKTLWLGDYRGGELKGTEVLAPSKIKYNGKLIDLFEKNDNGYQYVTEKDGYFALNENMIDASLLENFTFRTPTSSHGSASNIKIVGFLPSIMGDLMITPKNFVAQMGQDFDVDKLNTYQLNHIVRDNGKIEELTAENKDQYIEEGAALIRQYRSDLKAEKKFGSSTDGLIAALLGEDTLSDELIKELEGDIKDIKKRINVNFDLKLAQNRFIKIHNAVYNNPSAEVQMKINKVLSMDFAINQAEAIDDLTNDIQGNINLLSPIYQMNKMIAGSTGSSAIGVYAKGTTFNSLAQQSEVPISITEAAPTEDDSGNRENKVYQFGMVKSNGVFGSLNTKSADQKFEDKYNLSRKISEVLDEKVNTATDNEKAQVLGRVGITHIDAVAVDNFLAQQGIDAERLPLTKARYDETNPFHKTKIVKGEQIYYSEYSIPYLLASQPIIKEYFKRLKTSRAIVTGFDNSDIVAGLLGDGFVPLEDMNKHFTGQTMVNEIENDDINSNFQKHILLEYVSLMEDAKALKELQEVVDLSNLGKSMWNLKEKINDFIALPLQNTFANATSLLGTFNDESTGEKNELNMGEVFFTPTTNQGVMVGTALSMGRNLFFNYFPYYDPYISTMIGNVDKISKGKESAENKEKIFQEAKRYITANTSNGIFTGTPTEERQDLYMDTEDHQSLSTYTAGLLNATDENFEAGLEFVQKNVFFNRLAYERGVDGKPSLIKFDNTEVGNLTDEHYYAAVKEAFIRDLPLPNKNGQSYSTRMLIQDMVSYSYLGGGIVSQAIEFHKFIPIEYYDDMINPNTGTSITRAFQNYDTQVASWASYDRLKNFEKQYFQNNPDSAPQLPKDIKKTFTASGLTINTEMLTYPKFVAVKNKGVKSKLKKDKWSLFEQIADNNYKRIDVLGEFGMTEYDAKSDNVQTVVAPKKVKKEVVLEQTVKVTPPKNQPTEFTINEHDTPADVLTRITEMSVGYNPYLAENAKMLLNLFSDQMSHVKIKIENDITLPYSGKYLNGTVTMNMAENKHTAQTFVHEMVHAISHDYIKGFYLAPGQIRTDIQVPKEVQNLNILAVEYKNQIEKLYPQEYKIFTNKYAKFKNKEDTTFTPRELSVFYPTVNISEFIAVALGNNSKFIEEASKIPYKKSGMTVSEKFKKLLNDLLTKISGVENNLAEQILTSTVETIEVLNSPDQEVGPDEMYEAMDKLRNAMDNQGDPDAQVNGPTEETLLPECI